MSKGHSFKCEVDIFMDLGNTGVAMHRCWQYLRKTIDQAQAFGAHAARAQLKPLLDDSPNSLSDLLPLRSPDPNLVLKQELKCPQLQVMGSWQKIKNIPNPIAPRQGFASFVWNRESQICLHIRNLS